MLLFLVATGTFTINPDILYPVTCDTLTLTANVCDNLTLDAATDDSLALTTA